MSDKQWIGKTIFIENEPHEVVDQKPGPMLATISDDVHSYPLQPTIKLKVRPGKGTGFWLPPMRSQSPKKNEARTGGTDE